MRSRMMVDVFILLLVIWTAALTVTAVFFLFVRVPSIPTPPHIAKTMIEMVDWKGNERVIDLGAGDGRLLEAVKRAHPGVTAIGCEIVPTVWLMGVARAMVKKSGVTLRLQSMFNEDCSQADVIFLYLFPGLMKKLKTKFDQELKPGTVVVCQTFGFKDLKPVKEVRVPRWGSEVSVFVYQF